MLRHDDIERGREGYTQVGKGRWWGGGEFDCGDQSCGTYPAEILVPAETGPRLTGDMAANPFRSAVLDRRGVPADV